jgi:hypothetical protein
VLFGFREVIVNAAEVCPLAVAVIRMSAAWELNAVPVLVTVVCAPVSERLTLSDPWVTAQVVEEPPLKLRVIEVLYPDGDWPLNHHTVSGPVMVGGGGCKRT